MKTTNQDETTFTVWNETDGVYATPDTFRTQRNARKFVRKFLRRFLTQGFFRTFRGERISLNDVQLEIVEVETEYAEE